MERENVSSSNIVSIGFEAETSVLEVEFKGGSVYQYEDVPTSLHESLMSSPSQGKFFAQFIKDQFVTSKL